jgi:hypothetical protein
MSDMDPAIVAGSRTAVELLRVWIDQDRLTAAAFIDAVLNRPSGPGVPSIIAGQLRVGQALVAMLVQAYGAATDDEVRVMTGDILQDLAEEVAQ